MITNRINSKNITDKGIEILSEQLELTNGLEYLNLERCKNITDKSIPYLTKLVERLGIEKLVLKYSRVAKRSQLIDPVLNNTLKYRKDEIINLTQKDLDDIALISLCELFKSISPNAVVEFILPANKITSYGAIALFDTLREYHLKVKRIDLHKNKLDDYCMKSLGLFLHNNQTIEYIDIGYNEISDFGLNSLLTTAQNKFHLKAFDISYCKKITDKSAIDIIDLYKNQIANTVDITKTEIGFAPNWWKYQQQINRCVITTIEFGRKRLSDEITMKLSDIIKLDACNKLKELDLRSNNISSKGAIALLDALKNKVSLEILVLNSNPLQDDCMEPLAKLLSSLPRIEVVKLEELQITNQGFEMFAKEFNGNKAIKVLTILDNLQLTYEIVPSVIHLLQNSKVEKIIQNLNKFPYMRQLYLPILKNTLQNGSPIIDLVCPKARHIGYPNYDIMERINDDIVLEMCKLFSFYAPCSLQSITIYASNVTETGFSSLFEALSNCCPNLKSLNLNNNNITDVCMHSLGRYIEESQTLENLAIGENLITDEGIRILFEYLVGNVVLNTLNISNLQFTNKTAEILIDNIIKTALKTIYIWGTSISMELQYHIQQQAKIPLEEREIPIKSNTKSAAKITSSSIFS